MTSTSLQDDVSPPSTIGTHRATAAPPDPRRWKALAVIAIAQLMVVLDASIVNIALPSAARDLGISDINRQWVVTAYTLAFGGLLLLGGRIADYRGRKRMFITGLIAFAAASALGGIAPNQELLFAARALQGAAGALLAPAALALITVTFTEPKERARAFGVYGAIAGGGAAIGLILGGTLTEYSSWRWCLLVNIPIALGAAAAAVRLVTESRASGDRSYDVPGAVTVTLGLVSLVYGFTRAAADGWGAGLTLALLGIALLLLVTFVVIETRTTHPLLPLRVLTERNRAGSFLASTLIGSGLFAMFLFLTFYLQGTLGYSALRAGFAFLPFSAGVIVAAGISSQLLVRVGPRPLMVTGLGAASIGLFYLSRLPVGGSYVTDILPALVVMSVGLGLAFVPLSSTALIGVGEHDAGVASAMVNTTQQVGGSLGTALLSTIAATAAGNYLVGRPPGAASGRAAAVEGYTTAFFYGGILLAVASITTAVLIRAKKDELPTDAAVVA